MKTIKKFLVLIIAIIVGFSFYKIYQNNQSIPISKPIQGVKFTGTITEIENGCWADGACSIKVDDNWITAEIGGLRPSNSKPEIKGNLIGISLSQDTNKYIGKKVEVYAKQLENDKNYFTIYGNSSYYIKLLE